MDDYRRLAKERHAKKLKQDQAMRAVEEKKQEDAALEQALRDWVAYQQHTLAAQGFSPEQVEVLTQQLNFADCLNFNADDYQGENLPFVFRAVVADYPMGYNLRDVMLLQDVLGHSPVQTYVRMGWTEQLWSAAVAKWRLVNPYPIQAINTWQCYRVDVDPVSVVDTVVSQLGTFYDQLDVRGCGRIHAPSSVYRYIQEQMADHHFSSSQPFVVVQLAFQRPKTTAVMSTDFVVLQFEEPYASPDRIRLSPVVAARNQIRTNQEVHCRLVNLQAIRSAANGVGVRLVYCAVASTPVDVEPTVEHLQEELERHYILLKNQWIILHKNGNVWLYRVKTLWSATGRPVHAANIFGALVSIEVVTEPHQARELCEWINEWFISKT